MYPSQLDTPVALIFFIRPETFSRVFERVRQARPSRLFLIQDGVRAEHPEDEDRIVACRKIAQNIDWECEVYKNYSDWNLGCGLRPSSGISWVFEHVDRTIILEDDCVPDPSFFPYCEYMLEKYKDDERVCMISGLNHFGTYKEEDSDCFLARTGAIGGWATWKRVWSQYDFAVKAAGDVQALRQLEGDIRHRRAAKQIIKTLRQTHELAEQGIPLSYWDVQWDFVKYSQGMLSVIPSRSLICNVGIGSGSSHSASKLRLLPKLIAGFFFQKTYEINIPPTLPSLPLCCRDYDKKYYDIVYPPFIIRVLRKLKRLITAFLYRDKSGV